MITINAPVHIYIYIYIMHTYVPDMDHLIVQERIAYSKTLKGRYFDLVGHFFSVYCVYKIFIVSGDHVMLLWDRVTPAYCVYAVHH